jgi:denticleless
VLIISVASKCGSASHLAVATEQGTVHILDVSARKDWDPEPPRTVIRPHENGVFDVRWSPSDDRLATCSADRTSIISDPRRPDVPALNILHGHEDTLKCVAWQTENILATGDRGGKIKLWDLRVQPHSNNQLESVATMVQKPLPMIKARKARLGAAPARSITGLLFAEAQQSSYMIIGSTSTNG